MAHLAKTKYADVGAAFINWLISSHGIGAADVRPEPDPGDHDGAPAAKGNAYLTSVATGWKQLVKSNGLTLYPRLGVDQHAHHDGRRSSRR